MLPGGQCRRGLLVVEVIRRGDVDHIDSRVGQHGLQALVCGRQAKRDSALDGSGAAGSNHAVNLHAHAAQRFDVNHADETGADDSGADFSDGSWSAARRQTELRLSASHYRPDEGILDRLVGRVLLGADPASETVFHISFAGFSGCPLFSEHLASLGEGGPTSLQ
jgi:hypothetical protein